MAIPLDRDVRLDRLVGALLQACTLASEKYSVCDHPVRHTHGCCLSLGASTTSAATINGCPPRAEFPSATVTRRPISGHPTDPVCAFTKSRLVAQAG